MDNVVETIVDQINKILPLNSKRVALMINNLGGTPLMELYVAARAAEKCLANKLSATVERMYVGSFMTSLEMQGLMVTCFVVEDQLQMARVDALTAAPAWPSSAKVPNSVEKESVVQVVDIDVEEKTLGGPDPEVSERLKQACKIIIENEKRLNELDAIVGDGDCGLTLRRGAVAIMSQIDNLPSSVPSSLCTALAKR